VWGQATRPHVRAHLGKRWIIKQESNPRILLIPCSCGDTFTVGADYDRSGMHLRSFIPCAKCGKRHDPLNRLLRLGYQQEHFWAVDGC
jgi:hypothetical protein